MEAEPKVEADGVFHQGFDGIEAHAHVGQFPGLGDNLQGQLLSEAQPAKARAHVEALHLADAGLELAEGDAAGGLSVCFIVRFRRSL